MTQLRLIGSLTSPYVRFVRVVLAEMDIEHTFDATLPFGKMTEAEIEAINTANPLMKVPVLLTPDGPLIDSRVIVEWLLAQHEGASSFGAGFPENLARLNALTTLYGVLDAGVLRFLMAARHPEVDMDSGYMARSLERITHGLAWLDGCEDIGETFGPPEALLVCCVEWLKRRNVYDVAEMTRLSKIVNAFANRPSTLATRIPKDA